MSAHKNHHYVPQFYLRRFSSDGKSISSLIMKELRVVENASIRKQCQKANFYGKGTTEQGFEMLEGDVATILREMERLRQFPSRLSQDHQMLMLYLASQRARTSQAVREQLQFADEFTRRYIRDRLLADSDVREKLDDFEFKIPDPVSENLKTLLPAFPLLLDLAPLFVENHTAIGFITSDHPVVLYNQVYEGERFGSFTGFQSRGLQIIFPISSRLLIFFFDDGVYSLGRRRPRVVQIKDRADVASLNRVQFLTAESSIYFDPRANSPCEIVEAYSQVKHLRRTQFASWKQFEEQVGEDSCRNVHVFIREDAKSGLKLSFINPKQGWGKPGPNSEKVRMPALCLLHKRFMNEVRDGKVMPGDFIEYSLKRAPQVWRNG